MNLCQKRTRKRELLEEMNKVFPWAGLGCGYRGLRLPGDMLGTSADLAKQAYYRIGLRIRAELTVLEQHVGLAARPGADDASTLRVTIGAYRCAFRPQEARQEIGGSGVFGASTDAGE